MKIIIEVEPNTDHDGVFPDEDGFYWFTFKDSDGRQYTLFLSKEQFEEVK